MYNQLFTNAVYETTAWKKIASADFQPFFSIAHLNLCALITHFYLFFSCGLLLPPLLHHHLHPSLLFHCPRSLRSLHLESHKRIILKRHESIFNQYLQSKPHDIVFLSDSLPSTSFFFSSSISFWNCRNKASLGSSLILALFLMFLALLA